MRIVVLGATGRLGARVADRLTERGHDVVRAARSTGVDAYTGAGLAAATDGAEVVVDCLDRRTVRASTAVEWFGTTARNVVAAAGGEARLVCVSIVGAADPRVHRRMGYYRGKAEQERVYDASGRADVVWTTQWYELAETFLATRIGPIAFVPHMHSRPLAADDAASFVAGVADGTGGPDRVAAGPDLLDLGDLARRIARHDGGPTVVTIPGSGAILPRGGLYPPASARIAPTTAEVWLRRRDAATPGGGPTRSDGPE